MFAGPQVQGGSDRARRGGRHQKCGLSLSKPPLAALRKCGLSLSKPPLAALRKCGLSLSKPPLAALQKCGLSLSEPLLLDRQTLSGLCLVHSEDQQCHRLAGT